MARTGSTTVTPNEVRDRLNLTTADITDERLNGAAFILMGDAWETGLLSINSTTLANLDQWKADLLKAAKIALVSMIVVRSAPEEEFQEGPIRMKPISSKDKKELCDELEKELRKYLDMAGLYEFKWADLITSAGGADYHPSGEDVTQIDYVQSGEDSDDSFRVFP